MTKRSQLVCSSLWLLASCTFEVPVGTSQTAPPALRDQGDSTSDPAAAGMTEAALNSSLTGSVTGAHPSGATDPGNGASDANVVAEAGDDWPMLGRDYQHSSASTEHADFDAKRALAPAWSDGAAAVTGTPAIYDGVVYWADFDGRVYATSLESGEKVWRTELDAGVTSSAFVTKSRVYVADRHATVYALDRKNGARLWDSQLSDSDSARIWSSPMVVDDTLIIGVSAVATDSGSTTALSIVALQASTGQKVWASEVREAQMLTATSAAGASVSMWSTAAIDASRGLALLCLGRSDAALVGWDVLIGIDYQTGALAYAVPLENPDQAPAAGPELAPFESDGSFHPDAAPLLFSAIDQGKPLELVGVPSRSGVFRAHHREDGQPAWMTPIRNLSGVQGIVPNRVAGMMVPAAFAEGVVYAAYSDFATRSSRVKALDAASGRSIWETKLEGLALGGLATIGEALLATTTDFDSPSDDLGNLFVLGAKTGLVDQVYGNLSPGGNAGGIALSGNTVVLGSGFAFEEAKHVDGGIAALAF